MWATGLHPAAELSMSRLARNLSSASGNVVCRVATGGGTYRIIVTDRDLEEDRVVSVSGERTTGAS